MKNWLLIGIVLAIAGAIVLAAQGLSYTSREKVVDVAGIQVVTETQKKIPVAFILGGVAVVGGVAIAVAAARKRKA